MNLKRFVAAALACCCAVAAAADTTGKTNRNAVSKELEHFTGTWEITAVQPDGATQQAKRLVFRKDMTYAALDEDGQELWGGTFDLAPTAEPKLWDHRSYEAIKTGGDALGIYELDGDQLKVACVVGTWSDGQWRGKPRPTQFKLPAADVVIKLRRVPSDDRRQPASE